MEVLDEQAEAVANNEYIPHRFGDTTAWFAAAVRLAKRALEAEAELATLRSENERLKAQATVVKPAWIRVEDRLPTSIDDYLVRIRIPCGGVNICTTDIHTWMGDKGWPEECESLRITHWMAIPEPPPGTQATQKGSE